MASGREKHSLLPPSAPSAPVSARLGRPFGDSPGLRNVFFSPNSRLVATADASFVIWDVATGREERQIPLPQNGVVRAVAFSPDGRTVAIELAKRRGESLGTGVGPEATDDQRPCRGPPLLPRQRPGHQPGRCGNSMTLAFSPDGRLLAQAQEREVRLWDLHSGQEVGVLDGHRGPLTALAFAPDGKHLASASSDTTGLVWTTEPARKKLAPLAAVLTKEKVAALWSDLGASDAARAYAAVLALAGDPAKSVPFLGDHLKPAVAPDARQVARLIADLDADAFQSRESAHDELARLGELALAPMRAALEEQPLRGTAAPAGRLGDRRRRANAIGRAPSSAAGPGGAGAGGHAGSDQGAEGDGRRRAGYVADDAGPGNPRADGNEMMAAARGFAWYQAKPQAAVTATSSCAFSACRLLPAR